MVIFMGCNGKTGPSLTANDFRDLLAAVGYTQAGLSRVIGANGRTVKKWALGEARIPGSVVLLLRLLQARPELRSVIDGMARPPSRPRRENAVKTPVASRG